MPLPAATSNTILSTLSAASSRLSAFFLLVCAFAASTVLLPVHTQAQQPTTQEPRTQEQQPDDEVVRVNTDLFVVPIRIRDKRGPTAILTEQDLSLKDPDHVTAGLTLYHGADRVAVIFALDQSGSLRDIASRQREAALALVERFGSKSQVAVLRFAEKPSLVTPFDKDTSQAREAFSFSVRANQHTAIFDAAVAAVKAFDGLPPIRSERRIVVLISDGLDNASATKPSSVVQAALRNHVSFYVIHVPLIEVRDGRLAVRSPAKGFRELAEKTGGKYFLIGDLHAALSVPPNRAAVDWTAIFQAIEEDLRSQYLLGWYAGEGSRDGRSHRFTISFPEGVESQIGGFKYMRTQEVFLPGEPEKTHK